MTSVKENTPVIGTASQALTKNESRILRSIYLIEEFLRAPSRIEDVRRVMEKDGMAFRDVMISCDHLDRLGYLSSNMRVIRSPRQLEKTPAGAEPELVYLLTEKGARYLASQQIDGVSAQTSRWQIGALGMAATGVVLACVTPAVDIQALLPAGLVMGFAGAYAYLTAVLAQAVQR